MKVAIVKGNFYLQNLKLYVNFVFIYVPCFIFMSIILIENMVVTINFLYKVTFLKVME